GAEAAVQGELLEQGSPLRFISPLVRSVIYHDIPASRRARLHGEAARLLARRGGSEEDVRVHLLLTEPAQDAETAAWLARTGRAALNSADYDTAIRCLDR